MFVSVPKGDAIFMKVRFMSLFLKWKFFRKYPTRPVAVFFALFGLSPSPKSCY